METLVAYAIQYHELYKQNISGVFHIACGCVCGQQVAFNVGRQIRKQLYEICGTPLTPKAILEKDLTQIKNLTSIRLKLLLQMAMIDDQRSVDVVIDDYLKLKGFGEWTAGAVAILAGTDKLINLSSDSFIRKNLSIYTGSTLTVKQCHDYILTANENQTIVCYFLWRIKPQSINKLDKNKILKKSDFV